jgi:FKBP-type peptidyl-prolyl cis-trans isomerase 2
MKKELIYLLILITLFSGCVGEKTVKTGDNITVKTGDNISVDYTGSLLNGKVFDTSIEKVAKENNLSNHGSKYKPINFTVGKGQMIKGFDEGVIGMKVGETRKLTIPPEKAYGQSNPQMIQVIPILQEIPATRVLPKNFEVPVGQFEGLLGPGHKKGENVTIPETNINLTILNISSDNSSNVSLSYNLKMGDEVWMQGGPWNETVVKIDDKNITLRANVSENDIVQLQGAPWNTTVVGLNNVNITLRHNPVQDTVIPGRFGQMKVRFNETSVILDQNPELAGQTLIFNVTIVSIDK